MTSAGVAALSRRIESMDGRGVSIAAAADARAVGFGAPELDGLFRGGGLEPGVHQMAGDGTATLGLAVAIVGRIAAAEPLARVLMVQEADARREHGGLYAPGLKALGADPDRIALVEAHDGDEALRIADDALRSRAWRAVVIELRRGERRVDLSLTRRFNLAAAQSKALALLLTPTLEATSAALSRWTVVAAPSLGARRLGRPVFALDLVKNRAGPIGAVVLEWDAHDRNFRTPDRRTPLSAPLSAAPADRPSAPTAGGALDGAGGGGRPGQERPAAGFARRAG